MAEPLQAGVAVIGGGIVGLACGLHLAAEGKDVLLVDAETRPVGTSAGNAATFAAYNCVPVGTPGVLRNLPNLLLDRDSPLAMRWAALPALAPWLIRFIRQSLPGPAAANAAALAALLHRSLAAWNDLAAEAAATELMRPTGAMYLFPDAAALAGAEWNRAQRDAGGIRQFVVEPAEIAALEPALADWRGPGIHFPDATHLADPALMLQRLRAAIVARGGRIIRGQVTSLAAEGDGVRLGGPGLSIRAGAAVIAAGAWSRGLARQAGDAVPLETERGYHLEYAMDAPLLSRPVCPIRFGVYLTPLAGRLRAAGTVELGGLNRGPTPRRAELLDRAARTVFPDLPPPGPLWLGFRPSLPDSLPVIGPSRRSARVIHAYGHGHLGLTLAAVTARNVAALLRGGTAPDRLTAFSPQRFG